jgi:anthranilate phosphoribosyltransferase
LNPCGGAPPSPPERKSGTCAHASAVRRSDQRIAAIRDYCILNAAAALWVAGVAADWKEAAAKCKAAIDSGA